LLVGSTSRGTNRKGVRRRRQRSHNGDPGDLIKVTGGVARAFVNVSHSPSSQPILMLPAMDSIAFFTRLGNRISQSLTNAARSEE